MNAKFMWKSKDDVHDYEDIGVTATVSEHEWTIKDILVTDSWDCSDIGDRWDNGNIYSFRV